MSLSLLDQVIMSGQTKWRQGQLTAKPDNPALAKPHGKSRLAGDNQRDEERVGGQQMRLR